jgi:hypothetical protein
LIPPVIEEGGTHPILPPFILSAWLVDPCETESHLVVVWFREEFDHLPLSRIIGEAVRILPWHDLAGTFSS